jgi:hypothetical protein
MNWSLDSSSSLPALQVRSPELKLQSHEKKKLALPVIVSLVERSNYLLIKF